MFGRKKADKLVEDIDRYFDMIDQSVLVFKEGVRNYLYSNHEDFNGNLIKTTSWVTALPMSWSRPARLA